MTPELLGFGPGLGHLSQTGFASTGQGGLETVCETGDIPGMPALASQRVGCSAVICPQQQHCTGQSVRLVKVRRATPAGRSLKLPLRTVRRKRCALAVTARLDPIAVR